MSPSLANGPEETYDYIVCGGGTSGSVVAGRLAEDENVKILVVEAGVDNKDLENVHMAGGWTQLFDTDTDWNIETVPMPGVNNRVVKNSRGRFLGGSSGCNGTLCIRGTKQDYDDWDLEGWSGDEVFRCMAKSETYHPKTWFRAEDKLHGFDGPLHIEPHDLAPISELMMESYVSAGMPFDSDMFTHGRNPQGCGHALRTVHQGIRTTGADFITKDYRRENISISCETTVDKILFEPGQNGGNPVATHVSFVSKDGRTRTVRAKREIILSGGAYCTPAILLRSGIGPADELKKNEISVIHDSPGVGKNLMDHLIVFIFYEVDKPGLTNDHLVYYDEGKAFATTYELWKEKKQGFLSTFPFGAFAFSRLDERLANSALWTDAHRQPGRDPMGLTKSQPNIEFFHTELYGGPKQYMDFPGQDQCAFAILPELFGPRSRGTVKIESSDPLKNPIVDHNYLDDEIDLLVLSEACRYGNEIVMKEKGTKDVVKGAWPQQSRHHEYTTREEWSEFVKDNATTCYHPAGTAKMGRASDPMAVCDEQLRVRGVENLRVCDVSVMPKLNQGHTQMPAYAIGEKCAEMIRKR